jgi:hypothetical protein
VRLFFVLVVGGVLLALGILFLGSLGQVSPGNPFIAVAIGLFVLIAGVWTFRSVARSRGPDEHTDPEDVGDLDVFFVCGECGTEFRVEKIGELQVPRHCGETMRVERRTRGSAAQR